MKSDSYEKHKELLGLRKTQLDEGFAEDTTGAQRGKERSVVKFQGHNKRKRQRKGKLKGIRQWLAD